MFIIKYTSSQQTSFKDENHLHTR